MSNPNQKFIKNETKEIDLNAKPNIKLTLNQIKNNPQLIDLFIEGKDADYSIANAIRRTMMQLIPIYAFHSSNMTISKNSTIYNNDMMMQILQSIPIPKINNPYDLESPEIYIPEDVHKQLFGPLTQETSISYDELKTREEIPVRNDEKKKTLKIEFYLSKENNADEICWVSTHDGKLLINGVEKDYFKSIKPIYLFRMRPTQVISAKMTANLGIALLHGCYEATTNVVYEMINDNKFHLTSKSLEQLTSQMIIQKSLIILKKKLLNLGAFITENFLSQNDGNLHISLELHNEDHTLGNLIASVLQRIQVVEKAGYVMPHPLKRYIVIDYVVDPKSKKNPYVILIDVINYLIKIFDIMIEDTK
jgi:DNA-directed RNA polymerase subunit L